MDLINTKIIATIGPSSNSIEILEQLIDTGVDIFRLNFSHGSYTFFEELINNIRKIESKKNITIPIVQDLQGPKIRLLIPENIKINKGEDFILARTDVDYPKFLHEVKINERILIDDGRIELKVSSIHNENLTCKVIRGGILKPRKGVNLPDTKLSLPSLTEKDKKDIEFGLGHNVDYIALSFVRSSNDITELKKQINGRKLSGIISKIEKPEAVKNIDSIFQESDIILVARGDLGIEIDLPFVPAIQNQIIQAGKKYKKPVIVATQMLESMIENSFPTRAEVTDVYQAVKSGADIVMLSGETASGKFPVQTAEMMNSIIEVAEKEIQADWPLIKNISSVEEAIAFSGAAITDNISARFICVYTSTGHTAQLVSKCSLKHPILAFTHSEETMRKISMYRGVRCIKVEEIRSIDELFVNTSKVLIENKYAKKGDRIVIVTGQPLCKAGNTNLLKVHTV